MRVACVQFTALSDIAANSGQLRGLIDDAARQGATLIATPENSCQILAPGGDKRRTACAFDDHPVLRMAADRARAHNVYVWIGSVMVPAGNGDDRLYNRSVLFDPSGSVSATYDKIHLFDVDLPTGESHRESAIIQPGTTLVTSPMADDWVLGFSICYDLRFPHLYRALAQAGGATLIAIPAAFTVPTGEAHWHTLVRARAIENQCYVIAPAQCGTHEGGRKTYGHSLIIDPWGRVLADAGVTPGIITADLSRAELERVRSAVPSLRHDRPFTARDL